MRAAFRALALPILLAGCQQHDDRATERPIVPTAHARAVPAKQVKPGNPVHPAKPKPLNTVVLAADGVTFGSPAGKTREFSFGAPQAEMEAIAARFLGAASEHSRNAECGAGAMEFARYGPLTLNFQDGKLVGWFAHKGPLIVTSDSIRPGALMRDLHVSRSARMIEGSTLEGEFEYLAADGHTIGGFASGQGRDAKIDSLYAGVNCFFR